MRRKLVYMMLHESRTPWCSGCQLVLVLFRDILGWAGGGHLHFCEAANACVRVQLPGEWSAALGGVSGLSLLQSVMPAQAMASMQVPCRPCPVGACALS